MRTKSSFLAAAAVLVMTASYAAQTSAQHGPAVVAADSDITVSVINRNWLDVRIYAVSASRTVRLGTVSSFGMERFKLPRTLQASSSDLQFVVRPIGQRGVFYSAPVLASPGDNVEFTVENHLALSSAVIY